MDLQPLPGFGAGAEIPRPSFLARMLPCFLAFLASFCIMVVELVAGRVIARHLGQSLYTWTSVIGVVLAGITIGNWIGGRLADRFRPRRLLALLFFLAALAAIAIPRFDYWVGTEDIIKLSKIESWPWRIAAHVTVVFLAPSTILGLIGPVVAKMALDQGLATGRTVGNVYAWGALGSIVGTFITGFWLIQLMGTVGILFCVGGVLALVALCLAPFVGVPLVIVGATLFFFELKHGPWEVAEGRFSVRLKHDSEVLYVDESQYSYIKIEEDDNRRELVLDHLIHAYYDTENVTELHYDYEEIYASVTRRFAGDRERLSTLFIGGGGYIFPRYILASWPASHVEVAEIDPGVTRADIAFFGLSPDEVRIMARGEPCPATSEPPALVSPPGERDAGKAAVDGEKAPDEGEDTKKTVASRPIEVYHLDARLHVEDLLRRKRAGKLEPFDFVYGDAFNDFTVPFHLITREFTEKIRDVLRPETGIYLINIIDIYGSGRFLGAVYNTLGKVFPHVYIYSNTDDGPDVEDRDTYIVIGALRELDLEKLGEREGEEEFTGSRLTEAHLEELRERSRGIVLTDDFSPVENLLEPVVREH